MTNKEKEAIKNLSPVDDVKKKDNKVILAKLFPDSSISRYVVRQGNKVLYIGPEDIARDYFMSYVSKMKNEQY